MNGKLVGGFIVLSALLAGGAIYYAQEYAYYQVLEASAPAAEIRLTNLETGQPEPILSEAYQGIDADSSPLLTETFTVYEAATPLNGPRWFSCYDAAQIGADLESGAAVAFLSESNIQPGVDRVVAVYPDGRAFVWQQLNDDAETK